MAHAFCSSSVSGARRSNLAHCRCHSVSHNLISGNSISRRTWGGVFLSSTVSLVSSTEAIAAEEGSWAQIDKRRMLHPVIVVSDMKAAQSFYINILGMKSLRYRSFPDGSANGFVGFDSEEDGVVFELVQQAKPPEIKIGSGFRHFSVTVRSLEGVLQKATDSGYEIVEGSAWESGEVYIQLFPKVGRTQVTYTIMSSGEFRNRIIQRVQIDPSGYLWEVMPCGMESEAVKEINLLVSDIEASARFYRKVMGMRVTNMEGSEGPRGFKRVTMGWAEDRTCLSLTQPQKLPSIPLNTGSSSYLQLAISTQDVYRTAEDAKGWDGPGGNILRAPGPVPGIGTKVAKVADPDGWVLALVDADDFAKELCAVGTGSSRICSKPVA